MESEDIYKKAQRDIIASLAYFNALNGLFRKDVHISLEQFRVSLEDAKDDKYFWYRTTLRSFFAYVDGIIYIMKDIILWAHKRKEIELSESEVLIIKEERPVFRKKKVEVTSSYNSFDVNFDLSMMYFPRVFHSNFKMNKGENRYNTFRKSLENRHSVTHPKRMEDYLIPPEGAEDLKNAIIWFSETMQALMSSCSSSSESLKRVIIERYGGTLEGYQQSFNESP